MRELKKDVRSAHFQFGNSETNYVTSAARTMVQHQMPMGTKEHLQAAKESMRKSNLTLASIPDKSPVKTTNNDFQSALEDPQATIDNRPVPLPR